MQLLYKMLYILFLAQCEGAMSCLKVGLFFISNWKMLSRKIPVSVFYHVDSAVALNQWTCTYFRPNASYNIRR